MAALTEGDEARCDYATRSAGCSQARPARDGIRAGATTATRTTRRGCRAAAYSVAVARIVFGAVIVASAAGILAYGWVDELWVRPDVLLGWPGLTVPVLPRPALIGVVAGVGACGAAIAAGFVTRPARWWRSASAWATSSCSTAPPT